MNISHKLRRNIVGVFSNLLILLFGYAAVTKLLTYNDSVSKLNDSPFIGDYANFIGWFIPVAELVIVALLIVSRTVLMGFYASLLLMTVFTAYIIAMLNYSYYIPCSCGGVISMLTWEAHIYFNLFFIIISIMGILLITKENKENVAV